MKIGGVIGTFVGTVIANQVVENLGFFELIFTGEAKHRKVVGIFKWIGIAIGAFFGCGAGVELEKNS